MYGFWAFCPTKRNAPEESSYLYLVGTKRKNRCETYDFTIFLQETWTTKQNLDFLSAISDHHFSLGYSPIDECDEPRKGIPYGGTAIRRKKELFLQKELLVILVQSQD